MAAKQDLINELANYDIEVLERLLKYADQLIIPDSSLLVSTTMNDMIGKAHTLADEHFPEWTDRSKSDFGQFLVELFAWFSEKDFWYMNAMANQYVLSEMVDYDIAFQRVLQLGAGPQDYLPGRLKILLTFAAGTPVEIPAGTLRIKDLNSNVIYSNYDAITINEVDIVTRHITFIQGVFQTSSLPFSGNVARVPFARTFIDKVFVNTVEWDETEDFSTSGISSKHFTQSPDSIGRKLKFGDGTNGVRPEIGATVITNYYLSAFAFVLPLDTPEYNLEQNSSGRDITDIELTELLVEGKEQDVLPILKQKAYLHRKTSGVIIKPEDLQAVLEGYPDIVRAAAYVSDVLMNFYVVPVSAVSEDAEFLAELEDRVRDQVLGGLFPLGNLTTYISLVNMEITVFVLTGLVLTEKESEVRDATANFSDPAVAARYASDFVPSNYLNYILSNVSGVSNVVLDVLQGTTPQILQILPGEIIQHISNSGAITIETSSPTEYVREINGLKITVKYTA